MRNLGGCRKKNRAHQMCIRDRNGIVSRGKVCVTLGSSGVVLAFLDRPAPDQKHRIHTKCHAMTGAWEALGVTQSAALSMKWLVETIFEDKTPNRFQEYSSLAETVPALSEGQIGRAHV